VVGTQSEAKVESSGSHPVQVYEHPVSGEIVDGEGVVAIPCRIANLGTVGGERGTVADRCCAACESRGAAL